MKDPKNKLVTSDSEKLLSSVREEIAEEFLVMEAVTEQIEEKDFYTYHLLNEAEKMRKNKN
ncbi:hypothetical protein [Guptibacillus hwajinpoensis]|uniref:Uncharacterized protein n=2 Tax=Guptibacillus hwajinpoensis TaxID=208199 RepID=A0ABU0K6X4_9BACL|nr:MULTISPECIES: hypothetical protein [Alkalihalobacillus]KMM37111.1 hypothetical protein AB986_14605 [Alkalihalobacillus macyae]MDP4552463.1 hypothetical protein [Alkalihalobacillus macyae]MDQ0484375.1 hypothetical protein [Alkalihalobacillus hemicentroti]